MRMPWAPSKPDQSLAGGIGPGRLLQRQADADRQTVVRSRRATGRGPGNPRTEFPENESSGARGGYRRDGILQPIVVYGLGSDGRYRVLFGAKRLRAAKIAETSRGARRHRHFGP